MEGGGVGVANVGAALGVLSEDVVLDRATLGGDGGTGGRIGVGAGAGVAPEGVVPHPLAGSAVGEVDQRVAEGVSVDQVVGRLDGRARHDGLYDFVPRHDGVPDRRAPAVVHIDEVPEDISLEPDILQDQVPARDLDGPGVRAGVIDDPGVRHVELAVEAEVVPVDLDLGVAPRADGDDIARIGVIDGVLDVVVQIGRAHV